MADDDNITRICKDCGEEKLLSGFFIYKTGRMAGKPYGTCKACRKARGATWRKENPEKALAYTRNWIERNRETHDAKKREYMREYRKSKPEVLRAWLAKNPGRKRELILAWRKRNPERQRELWKQNFHKRRAQKLGSNGCISAADERYLFAKQRGRCPACRKKLGKPYHLDHIVSLSRGGANDRTNAQLLHPDCNQRKHAKDPIAFMQELGFLL